MLVDPNTLDEQTHARLPRAMNLVFILRVLAAQEPILQKNVDSFLGSITTSVAPGIGQLICVFGTTT